MNVETFQREAREAVMSGETEAFVLKWVPLVLEFVKAKNNEVGLLELQLVEAQTEE